VTWAEAYPTVYRSLAPEYRALPAEQVDRLLVGVLGPGAGLEYAESFLGDISSALGQVGKVVVKALPGAISGAISGAPGGLPGVIGGALIGGASSVLSGGSTPAAQSAPTTTGTSAAAVPSAPPAAIPASPAAPVGAATPTTPATPATPSTPATLAGTPGAALDASLVQLLTALSSPTVRDAITAMLLGGAGARTVPTATGTTVPAAAVTNMLGTLTAKASAEWDAIGPRPATDHLAVTSYAENVDAVNPEARAAWLYGQLAPPEDPGDGFDDGWDDGWEDVYDDLEAQLQALAESEDTDIADLDDGFDDGLYAPLAPSAADDPAETVGLWWR
jgi:hypothetical protein